ncbi:hypothetical protein [Agrobacterium salinitolerans]|uniref:hypothetical protein n=1 Tax=Agrobacterium salinitolerans TaxID=1183413 RepID=UPI0022C6992C|nr:hypothetical protein [Agrobacterium salinitolerans]
MFHAVPTTTRILAAIKVAGRALDETYGWLVLWLPIAPVIIVVGATMIALTGDSVTPFWLRLLAGIVTATSIFVIIFGGFFSALFFAGAAWRLARSPQPGKKSTGSSQLELGRWFWVSGTVLTLLWLIPFAITMENIASMVISSAVVTQPLG